MPLSSSHSPSHLRSSLSPKLISTMPKKNSLEYPVANNYVQLATRYKNDRKRDQAALKLYASARRKFGSREEISLLHRDLLYMCEMLDPTKDQTPKALATNYMYMKVSIKKTKKKIIDPILLSQAMYNFLENKELYSVGGRKFSKVLKSLLQTNAINNVILDIDLMTGRVGWIDVLQVVMKYLHPCRACKCLMYYEKLENEGCECGHEYAFHEMLSMKDDDDDGILAEDLVLLSKFKKEIQQFDKRSSVVNDWFDRNRYL